MNYVSYLAPALIESPKMEKCYVSYLAPALIESPKMAKCHDGMGWDGTAVKVDWMDSAEK